MKDSSLPRPSRITWLPVLLGVLLLVAGLGAAGLWFFLLATATACGHCGTVECPPDQREPVPRSSKPPPEGGVQQLALGAQNSCALTVRGEVWCWGWAETRVGSDPRPIVVDDGAKRGAAPYRVARAADTMLLRQNRFALCTIDSARRLRCSRAAEHDRATFQVKYEPWLELADTQSVVIGPNDACALRTDRSAWCWGLAGPKQDAPTPAHRQVQRLTLGVAHGCALLGAKGQTHLECWGENTQGQLGNWGPRTKPSGSPPEPSPSPPRTRAEVDDTAFVDIAAGAAHTCALTREGAIRCWGMNNAGQLGGAGTTPVRVAGLPHVTQLAVDKNTSCALGVDGAVYCWGAYACGAHMTDEACTHRPGKLASPGRAIDLAAGDRFVCARLADGQIACAGDDNARQLGAVLPFQEAPPLYGCSNKAWSEADRTDDLTPIVW